jgi:hypothetical protein
MAAKFIGDAVMAVWGTPVATEGDAERAVRAAMDVVEAVAELGQEVGAPDLRARAGVVTGEVAVTVGLGGEGVAGDAVNTAARVQAAATPGAVWVDASTYRLAGAAIGFADTGEHQLKGKAEPVQLWAATRVLSGVGGSQRTDGLEAPILGRDAELRTVRELFHACAERRVPRLVLVSGPAGVGKSRSSANASGSPRRTLRRRPPPSWRRVSRPSCPTRRNAPMSVPAWDGYLG